MIKFVKKQGTMAECLGVSPELAAKIDWAVDIMTAESKSLLYIVEWVRDNIEMNENEF